MNALGSGISSRVPGLNWLLLIEVATIVFGATFFYFYLPRLLGVVVTYALRLYTWRTLNARIEVQAIQFAPLGGRIAFRDLRYYSRNQSLRVLKGHLTWRYWLWRVRDDELRAKQPGNLSRPCRLSAVLEGVEWFLYNRTPSYDALLEALGIQLDELDGVRTDEKTTARDKESIRMDATVKRPAPVEGGIDWLRELLPVDIHAVAGSIILGNRSTKMLLITGFEEVSGTYSIVAARSEFDLYKQAFRFVFKIPRVIFRTNPDYVGPMREHGAQILAELRQKTDTADAVSASTHPGAWASFPAFLRILQTAGLDRFVAAFEPRLDQGKWEGLARYKPEIDGSSSTTEYAKLATLLETEELELEYYADSVGAVPTKDRRRTNVAGLEPFDIGNGDLSPEWGVDVKIKGGTVNYGPWTDRQRAELQRLFTPASLFDGKASERLEPGDARVHTALKIFIEFSASTVVRVPTREPSKDWKFDGETAGTSTHRTARPYGWLDLYVGPHSYVTFVLPMLANESGYETQLELHLDETTIKSSVNGDVMLSAHSCRVHCSMPSPLEWSAPREWQFRIALDRADIFLLRDHTVLIANVVKDMLSGDPVDYAHFVPCNYVFDVALTDYHLHLYLNDRNIVSNPLQVIDNTLLVFKGPKIDARVSAPSDQFEPALSQVDFAVSAHNVKTEMIVPQWHTHESFITEDTHDFGSVGALKIDGKYLFYGVVDPDNVERLTMSIDCRDTVFKAMLWVIMPIINMRDNYFGTMTQFTTLDELRNHGVGHIGDPVVESYREGVKDVYEVDIRIAFHDSVVVLPENLYSCTSALLLYAPEIQVDLRNHDFFMDMTVQVDPLELVPSEHYADQLRHGTVFDRAPDDGHLTIDGLEVTAHRMFGPNPLNETYVCIWDFVIGRIAGRLTPVGLDHALKAVVAILSSKAESEDDLPKVYVVTPVPDVTFLSARVGAIDLQLDVGDDLVASAQFDRGLTVTFDDLPCARYYKHIAAVVPLARVQVLGSVDPKRRQWSELASLTLDASLLVGITGADYEQRVARQLAFIRREDEPTRRVAFLYAGERRDGSHVASLFTPALAESVFFPADLADGVDTSSGRTGSSTEADAADVEGETEFDLRANLSSSGSSIPAAFVDGDLSSGDEEDDDQASMLDLGTPSASALPAPYWHLLPTATRHHGSLSADIAAFVTPSSRSAPLDLRSFRRRTAALSAKFAHLSDDVAADDVTHVAVVSRRQIEVSLSPLALDAVERVVKALPMVRDIDSTSRSSLQPTDSETIFDALQHDYTSEKRAQLKAATDETRKSAAFALDAANLTIRLTQDVLKAGDARTLSGASRASSADDRDVVSEVMFSLSRTHATLHEPYGGDRAVTLTTARAELVVSDLELAVPRVAASDRLPAPTNVLHLALDGGTVSGSLKDGYVDAHVDSGDMALRFLESASELVLGSVLPWIEGTTRVVGVMEQRAELVQRRRRRFVELALFHGQQEVAPSYEPRFLSFVPPLLQLAPDAQFETLRPDLGWKLLAHIRGVVRELGPTTLRRIEQGAREAPTYVDRRMQLRTCADALVEWRSWEERDTTGEDELVETERMQRTDIPLLQYLYGETEPGPSAAERIDGGAVRAKCGRLTATVIDQHGSGNRGAIGPFQIALAGQSGDRELVARGSVACGVLDVRVNPQLLDLVRHILQVQRIFVDRILAIQSGGVRPEFASTPTPRIALRLDLVATLESARLAATAEGMALSLDLQRASVMTHVRMPFATDPGGSTSLSLFVGLDRLVVAVTQEDDRTRELANVQLHDLRTHAVVRGHGSIETWTREPQRAAATASIIVASKRFEVQVTRSLLRLHDFVEDWRTHVVRRTKPVLDDLRKNFEVARTPSAIRTRSRSMLQPTTVPTLVDVVRVHGQVSVERLAIRLQATASLRVDYVLESILVHGKLDPLASTAPQFTHRSRLHSANGATPKFREKSSGGIQIGRQAIDFVGTGDGPTETLTLPTLRAALRTDGQHHSEVLVSLDQFVTRVTATTMDSLLAAQQRFGQEVTELNSLIARIRDATGGPKTSPTGPKAPPSSHTLDARIALQGFTVAIAGPTSTQFVEASLVEATLCRSAELQLIWHVAVSNLALSLGHGQLPKGGQAEVRFERGRRLAYFLLDLSAGNRELTAEELPASLATAEDGRRLVHCHIRLPKVHAVMQAAAVDALGDLASHFAHEIGRRRRERAADLKQAREQARSVLEQVGGATTGDGSSATGTTSFLSRCVLSIRASDIGIAIPLADDVDAAARAPTQPAFLVSTPGITFATRKGAAGFAEIRDLSAQFVPSFNQSLPRDFIGTSHPPVNRVLFPHMQATFEPVQSAAGTVHIRADSVVNGLGIDIDPTIVSALGRLADVFAASQERFAALAATDAFDAFGTAVDEAEQRQAIQAALDRPKRIKIVQTMFRFHQGEIRLAQRSRGNVTPGSPPVPAASRLAHRPSHRRNQSMAELPSRSSTLGSAGGPTRPDIFYLPGLTIQADYSSGVPEHEHDRLHVDAVVHSSRNTLTPSLIPFVAEVMHEVKAAMRRSSAKAAKRAARSASIAGGRRQASTVDARPATAAVPSTIGVAVRLRIDDSILEATCQPIAQVSTKLAWQSGTFLLTVAPRTGQLELTAHIDQVSLDVRHSFSSERNLHGAASGLALAVSAGRRDGALKPTVSVVADLPSLTGEANMRQLEDWLSFKAIWIDRLGAVVPSSSAEQPVASTAAAGESSVQAAFILVRIRQIGFKCLFGPSIGHSVVKLDRLVTRLRFVPGDSRTFSVAIGGIGVESFGRLVGRIALESFDFDTTMREKPATAGVTDAQQAQLLSITLRSGLLVATYDYLDNRVLALELDPLLVRLVDDLSLVGQDKLKLVCSIWVDGVKGLVTSRAIEAILRVVAEIDEQTSEARSKTRSALLTLDREQPQTQRGQTASPVAIPAAAVSSSPSSSSDALQPISELELHVGAITLGAFVRDFAEPRLARFDLSGVAATYKRDDEFDAARAQTSGPGLHRLSTLALGSVTVRSHHLSHIDRETIASRPIDAWFEATPSAKGELVMAVPTMTSRMEAWQPEGDRPVVRHRFQLRSAEAWDPRVKLELWSSIIRLGVEYKKAALNTLAETSSSSVATPSTPKADARPPAEAGPGVEMIALDNQIDPILFKFCDTLSGALILGRLINIRLAPNVMHRFLVLPLDATLDVLESLYRRELAQQK